jgi:hypothetical protein
MEQRRTSGKQGTKEDSAILGKTSGFPKGRTRASARLQPSCAGVDPGTMPPFGFWETRVVPFGPPVITPLPPEEATAKVTAGAAEDHRRNARKYKMIADWEKHQVFPRGDRATRCGFSPPCRCGSGYQNFSGRYRGIPHPQLGKD